MNDESAWATTLESWLASRQRLSGGENTVRAYGAAVREFFEFARSLNGTGPTGPGDVTAMHAELWVQHMAGDRNGRGPLSQATINLKLAALSSLYRYAQRVVRVVDGREVALWPRDRANPFDAVERSRVTPFGRSSYPTTDELKAILEMIDRETVAGKRDLALLMTIASTCRRSSEVLNLRWGDIETRGRDYSFAYRCKGGETRRAFLPELTYLAIVAYLVADDRPPHRMAAGDYVFRALDPERIRRLRPDAVVERNRPISNHQANRILKRYARLAGVDPAKAHIHGLRHAGARLRKEQARENGQPVDYEEMMHLLGHRHLGTTQIYCETVLDDPRDPGGDAAAEALMPKVAAKRRRARKAAGEQGALL